MNDEDIIDLFFDRKESAIFETDNKYGNHLSKLAMRILNCHEDAEECKNDTYFVGVMPLIVLNGKKLKSDTAVLLN